jgi:hypothetical protein
MAQSNTECPTQLPRKSHFGTNVVRERSTAGAKPARLPSRLHLCETLNEIADRALQLHSPS